jgi:hypothetical protein
LNQLVAVARLPVEQQLDALEGGAVKALPPIVAQLIGPLPGNAVGKTHRHIATHRYAAVALAAERFRARHGRWPDRLDDLVAVGLLTAVPLDPFDGKPLRWLTVHEGRIVYSVGVDRDDSGGAWESPNADAGGTDLVFRLYDPEKRRQPPRAPKAKSQTADGGPE